MVRFNSIPTKKFITLASLSAGLSICATGVQAQDSNLPDMGKLTATGGVSQVEGAGGGGLTPWALITGYGTRDSYGANAHYKPLNFDEIATDNQH